MAERAVAGREVKVPAEGVKGALVEEMLAARALGWVEEKGGAAEGLAVEVTAVAWGCRAGLGRVGRDQATGRPCLEAAARL